MLYNLVWQRIQLPLMVLPNYKLQVRSILTQPVSEVYSFLPLALQYFLLCQMPTCLLWKLLIITTLTYKK